MIPNFPVTERNQVRRLPKRGSYDQETIYKIVDEALICHVGFVENGQPFVVPTIHARQGDSLLLHGSRASRMLRHVQAGNPLCVAVTLMDGLVLARAVFHHSMNYRSAILFGTGRLVDGEEEKIRALQVVTEHIMPGRWEDARKPTRQELDQTTVVSMPIDSASAKVRTGPPADDEEDYGLSIWAGILPVRQQAQNPVNDPRLPAGIPLPQYLIDYERTRQ